MKDLLKRREELKEELKFYLLNPKGKTEEIHETIKEIEEIDFKEKVYFENDFKNQKYYIIYGLIDSLQDSIKKDDLLFDLNTNLIYDEFFDKEEIFEISEIVNNMSKLQEQIKKHLYIKITYKLYKENIYNFMKYYLKDFVEHIEYLKANFDYFDFLEFEKIEHLKEGTNELLQAFFKDNKKIEDKDFYCVF